MPTNGERLLSNLLLIHLTNTVGAITSGISGIRDIVQNSDLESVTLILLDIDVKVESTEVEECHRIGKSNYGSKKIKGSVARKHCLTGSNRGN